jgi:aldose sugar dehydrogenase
MSKNNNYANPLRMSNNPVRYPNSEKVVSKYSAPTAGKRNVNSGDTQYPFYWAHTSLVSVVSRLLIISTFFEIFVHSMELHIPRRQSKGSSRLSYLIPVLGLVLLVNLPSLSAAGQEQAPEVNPFTLPADEEPRTIRDPNLSFQEVVRGLYRPTAMAFLGNSSNDIIVTDKDNGTVTRILNGVVQPEPLVDVAVANNNDTNERGLLGMAVAKQNDTTTYVFLYYTESGDGRDGSDSEGVVPAGNRLYRYELVQEADGTAKLINPKLLLDLPARPGPRYNGGPLLISQNQNDTIVYLMVGDLDHRETQSENYEDGPPPDGTGGILAIDVEGRPLPNPVLVEQVGVNNEEGEAENEDDESDEGEDEEDNNEGDEESREEIGMLPYYFAYGIRNSFGMDIDPITGNLWDTENGRNNYDEINLVLPGFNSGWADIQGPASRPENEDVDLEEDLVDFDGRGEYRDPEFTWNITVGPTAIEFYNSTQLGEEYQNDIFVGDINNGRIYHFDLNEDRTGLMLGGGDGDDEDDDEGDGPLEDKVAENEEELVSGGVVFLEVGPDGNLYLLMYHVGRIMKISPVEPQ